MYQPSTNFIGKDPMQWWIGQVTDPEKGKWGDSLEKKQAGDDKDIYSHRCRVRIVGYHGNDTDLPDDELPLAHVLLPPNASTNAGQGQTMRYRGGEVVVGFFLDGEDGQQPIIFGTLFKQSFVTDKLKESEFKTQKQVDFIPYTPPESRQQAGGHQFSKGNSPVLLAFAAGEVNKAISQLKKENGTNQPVTNYTACEDNEISKISDAIKDFTKQLKTLQQLDSANAYVNPIYGGIVDIKSEVQITTNRIHNSMTKLVRRGRSWVIQDTLDKLSTTLQDQIPKPLQAPTGQATNALVNTMFCNFEKIQDGLEGYLSKSLENMIGQVLDVPTCGIENFLGDMFGQINNILDTQLGGLFDQLNNIQGGGIVLPSKTFSKAIKYANIVTNALECDAQNCPENSTYSSKNGVGLSIEDSFDSIISKMGISSLLDPVLGDLEDAIPALPSKPDCDTNVLKCGPPRVDFIGGGGQGVTGSAVVNALGNIIGVAIGDGGFGFREPPLISFVDGCDNGSGAGGYPIMSEVTDPNGNVSLGVSGVVMTNSGQGFLPNTTDTTRDENGNLVVKEVVPDPNANYDGAISYVTTLDRVIVENTGFGYADTDTVLVSGGSIDSEVLPSLPTDTTDTTVQPIQTPGQAQVELVISDGRIEGANVINGGFGFTSLPDLTINSDTGALARLIPVLKFTKIDDATQLADTNIPFDRNLPQSAVVTVISCITK